MVPSPELAYVTGMAMGDGNISNPNGRTYRLRITCDIKYPGIIERTITALRIVFPKNKVSVVTRKNGTCVDVSVYNKNIDTLFGWSMHKGKKIEQEIYVPSWIGSDPVFTKLFIQGLFESDGSIYLDRGYKMANLVSYNPELAYYARDVIAAFGFLPRVYVRQEKNGIKHTVRISKNVEAFITLFNIQKS